MIKTVPRNELATEIEALQRQFRILEINENGDTAEIHYETRANRAPGDVETRA